MTLLPRHRSGKCLSLFCLCLASSCLATLFTLFVYFASSFRHCCDLFACSCCLISFPCWCFPFFACVRFCFSLSLLCSDHTDFRLDRHLPVISLVYMSCGRLSAASVRLLGASACFISLSCSIFSRNRFVLLCCAFSVCCFLLFQAMVSEDLSCCSFLFRLFNDDDTHELFCFCNCVVLLCMILVGLR